MSRYLTPAKIGLLSVVSLYADSVVPTAATIPVLSFIMSYLLPPKGLTSRAEFSDAGDTTAIPIEDFQRATIKHASGIPGRTLWDLLLKKLWEINSFDAMHVFFDSLSLLLPKPQEEQQRESDYQGLRRMQFSRTSPFGTFIRRAQLEFARLQLHDGITLWKNFVTYRSTTLSMWRRRNPGIGKLSFDTNLTDGQLGKNELLFAILYGDLDDGDHAEVTVSTDDLEKLLEFQRDPSGVRITENMRKRLTQMALAGVTVPSLLHYVKFLDSWKSGDYPSSFDSLHRYFDYTMHNRDRTFYQYALLNLAILQKDFGCFSEAIAAIHETIATARENKDMGCLNYSLSWLYHFSKSYPDRLNEIRESGVLGTDKEALSFLKTKAKESGMWSLLSTSLLSDAKVALTNGESLAFAFESITKATHLNLVKRLTAGFGSEMGMQSALFNRLGVSYLAWAYNELFLECYGVYSPADDVLYAICRGVTALALKGRYEDALRRMDEIGGDILRTLKLQQFWTSHMSVLKLRRSLFRNELSAAESFLSQLRTNRQPDQELALVVRLLEINLHMRRQDHTKAMDILDKDAKEFHEHGADVFQQIKLMVLKARIYNKAGIPQKGFSVAIRAASLAYKARLLPALWDAIGALCKVLISLKEFEAATRLMESIMPQVLECEDCELAATSFSCLADAHMGLAGQMNAGSLKRKEHLVKASGYLDRSFDDMSRLGDVKGQCEMMAKKATIMHLNGDCVLASDYAAKYLDIQKAAKEEAV
ncbi:anaphase promoting complex subunit 5 [Trapelia coarctata]|nr:anaphase promoting complex subunit 5 [Trapelia coarctata]